MIRQAENQVVKKRGRPKKNSDYPILNDLENIEEDIILYFPKKIFKDKEDILNNNIKNNNDKEKEKKIEEINEIKINKKEILDIENNNYNEIENENKDKNRKKKKNNVECIKIENNINNKEIIEKKDINEKKEKGLFENNIYIYNINCPFELNPDNTIILKKTNLCCLWDTYEINDIPYFLPDYMKDGKFYIIGWFCSLNCAIAYNIKLNDEKVFERISLLKYMYGIDGEENITPSPNILILKKYGGIEDINNYRKNLNNIKSSRLVYKPMICNTPMFEEILK